MHKWLLIDWSWHTKWNSFINPDLVPAVAWGGETKRWKWHTYQEFLLLKPASRFFTLRSPEWVGLRPSNSRLWISLCPVSLLSLHPPESLCHSFSLNLWASICFLIVSELLSISGHIWVSVFPSFPTEELWALGMLLTPLCVNWGCSFCPAPEEFWSAVANNKGEESVRNTTTEEDKAIVWITITRKKDFSGTTEMLKHVCV